MNQMFQGVKVVEVAQYVFVPAAGTILADYGAEVIKVEPPGKGDAYRGLITSANQLERPVNIIFELNNRGKRSLAVDLKKKEGLEILHKLVAKADVFLTNFRPDALERLKLGVDDIRKHNPKIIYARGHGFGRRGPDSWRPGYDATAFWARSGFAHILTPAEAKEPVRQRAAFGDHIGSMNLAMGIASALFSRERTGKGVVVDVSLIASGMWVLSSDLVQSRFPGYTERMEGKVSYNPLINALKTKDGRWIQLVLLEPDRYWPALCERIERPELLKDPRFIDSKARTRNSAECTRILQETFAQKTYAEWLERLKTFDAPWEPMQNLDEIFADPQTVANQYAFDFEAENGKSYKLVAPPVEFNETPIGAKRAPRVGEHTEEILRGIGMSAEQVAACRANGTI
jgi:crotonobetainyl-CoA:carnitine CoA-transferase CaiB-like acyl-CoA transferase